MNSLDTMIATELAQLEAKANLRQLPQLTHRGKWVEVGGHTMLNLSSNDYLGLAADTELHQTYLEGLSVDRLLLSSSSSRLLTGNFAVYEELEEELAARF